MKKMTTIEESVPLSQSSHPGDGQIVGIQLELPKQRKKSSSHRDVDGGWAWVVLITSYWSRAIMGGMFWAINIYFVIYHEEFGESRSYTATIGSAMFFTFHLAGPLASIMIDRYGVRVTTIVGGVLVTINFFVNAFATGVLYLIFTHCIFLGIGQCLVSNAGLVGLSQYFRRYVNLTTALSLSGTGIGMFIFTRLVPYLIDIYGWRGSMFILSGISLHFCFFGCALFPLRTLSDNSNSNSKKENTFSCSRLNELISSPVLWCINLTFFCFTLSSVTILVLYKDIVMLYGMNDKYELCITVYATGDIVGRVMSGLVTSHPKIPPVVFYGCVHTLTGILVVFLTLSTHGPNAFMALGFFLGCSVGAQITLCSIVVLSMFGRERFVVVLGYVMSIAGFGALSGPPLTGYLTDVTGTYAAGLSLLAVINAFAALGCFLAHCLSRKQTKQDDKDAQEQLTLRIRDEYVLEKVKNGATEC